MEAMSIFFGDEMVKNPATGELIYELTEEHLEKILEEGNYAIEVINEYYVKIIDKNKKEYLYKTEDLEITLS